jgi:prefoldin subunit 5
MSRDEELNYLNDQAEAIKGQLEEIESRMQDLETDKKKGK